MRIFITGGTGFIGQWVVKELLAKKHQLLILSRTKNRPPFLKGDLATAGWQKKIAGFQPEATVHLAWEDLPDYGAAANIKNLRLSLSFLEFLAGIGCRKVLIAGTGWELLTPPPNAYAVAKNSLRALAEVWAKEQAVQLIWARLFYVYGPGQRPTALIPYLMGCQQRGETPQIKNPGQANDFVYIEDVARALTTILEKCQAKTVVYNIGSGQLTAVEKIRQIIYGESLKRQKVNGLKADLTLMKKEIGWRPTTTIEDGINRFRIFSKTNSQNRR